MKRLLSLVLCLSLVLAGFCVSAEERFYTVFFDTGDGISKERVILSEGEIYVSAKSFSNYTRFSFDAESACFLIKGQEADKAVKSVVVDVSGKQIVIDSGSFYASVLGMPVSRFQSIRLTDCFESGGEVYLPLCQMLPILNAEIYDIRDGVICIANSPLSLAEVLYDFDVTDYWFDMSEEFLDSSLLATTFVLPSYLLDTIGDFRLDRFDLLYHSGEYNDYKDIFSKLLADDNLYLKAKAMEPSKVETVMQLFRESNTTVKTIHSVYDWVEAAGKSPVLPETGGKLLESLQDYYHSGELMTDDLYGLTDAWTAGRISFADCLETVDYLFNYATQIEDNRLMLDAVYDTGGVIAKEEAARRAAKQIAQLYGEQAVPAILQEVRERISFAMLEALTSPGAVYRMTAQIAGAVLDEIMPFDAGDIARLPLYADTVLTAASKYEQRSFRTDESTDDLRLSLLLCMIASKRCFEIMRDTAEGTKQNTAYYQSRIDKIEPVIIALYMAAENTEFDSYEHFDGYADENRKKVAESQLLEEMRENEFIVMPKQGTYELAPNCLPEDWYAYITIKSGNRFDLKANWDLSNFEKTSPWNAEGTYTLRDEAGYNPDGSGLPATVIDLYLKDKRYVSYFISNDGNQFNDQVCAFDYNG